MIQSEKMLIWLSFKWGQAYTTLTKFIDSGIINDSVNYEEWQKCAELQAILSNILTNLGKASRQIKELL